MKNKDFFKANFSFQNNISASYSREADSFQAAYNKAHPSAHIWRHMLYPRTFFFYHNGRYFSVCVEIVRFRYAGTNRTFTFYGSLFCAFSQFSAEFIRQAVRDAALPSSPVADLISLETLGRWASLPLAPTSVPVTT